MARADRRRSAQSRSAAATSRYDSAYVGTDALFFQRLRRQAKWMFVFLALVFGVGFVAFGVGSDVQGGFAEIFRFGGSTGTSVGDAREKVEDNPRNAAAKFELGNALLADGQTDEAIAVLEEYTRLRPKDPDGLRTLAGIYLTQASQKQQVAFAAQQEVSRYSIVQTLLPQITTGAYLGDTVVNQALAQEANERFQTSLTEMQSAYDKAKATYQRLAAATPNDPDVQLELATAAEQSSDLATAITAYERFLELAPNDPSNDIVRRQLRELRRQQAASTATATPSG